MKNGTREAATTLRTANECLAEVGPEAEMLFDEFWRDGEVALLFGAAGTGKTILAMQIANALACGAGGIAGLRMPQRRRRVLYVDLEMSDAQFCGRYMYRRKNGEAEAYHFAKNLFIWRPTEPDGIIEKLEEAVEKDQIRAVVIDALPGGRWGRELMSALRRLKNDRGVAALVLAESGEPQPGAIVSEANLGRGRHLTTRFADSVFAVGRYPRAAKHFYLVQTRSRHPLCWTERNAPICTVEKTEKGALVFEFDERFRPRMDEATLATIRRIKAMVDGGRSYRIIAESLGISLGRVQRLYKRWTPAVGVDNYGQWPVADDGGQWPVVSGQQEKTGEESLAADGGGSARMSAGEEVEPEEWDEAGFERPDWIDIEREAEEEKARKAESETRDMTRETEEVRSTGRQENPATNGRELTRTFTEEQDDAERRPVTVAEGRSVYDLKRTVNADGYEIWVERYDEEFDWVPKVWYRIDRDDNMTRWERGPFGSTSTQMGRAR